MVMLCSVSVGASYFENYGFFVALFLLFLGTVLAGTDALMSVPVTLLLLVVANAIVYQNDSLILAPLICSALASTLLVRLVWACRFWLTFLLLIRAATALIPKIIMVVHMCFLGSWSHVLRAVIAVSFNVVTDNILTRPVGETSRKFACLQVAWRMMDSTKPAQAGMLLAGRVFPSVNVPLATKIFAILPALLIEWIAAFQVLLVNLTFLRLSTKIAFPNWALEMDILLRVVRKLPKEEYS